MIMSSLLDIPFQKLVDGRFSADGMDLDAILRRACRSIGSFLFLRRLADIVTTGCHDGLARVQLAGICTGPVGARCLFSIG